MISSFTFLETQGLLNLSVNTVELISSFNGLHPLHNKFRLGIDSDGRILVDSGLKGGDCVRCLIRTLFRHIEPKLHHVTKHFVPRGEFTLTDLSTRETNEKREEITNKRRKQTVSGKLIMFLKDKLL